MPRLSLLPLLVLLGLGGCCRNPVSPLLNDPAVRETPIDTPIAYALEDLVVDASLPLGELSYQVTTSDPEGVSGTVAGGELVLTPAAGWEGEVEVQLTVVDACDASSTVVFPLTVGDGRLGDPQDDPCSTVFRYTASGPGVSAVSVAGTFNDWSAEATPLTALGDGTFEAYLYLEPGAYAYKFVETDGSGGQSWRCDPEGALQQCDEGYTWAPTCALGAASCNSLVVVEDCAPPALSLSSLEIDREANALSLTLSWSAGSGGAALSSATLWVNGAAEPLSGWDGQSPYTLELTDLPEGRVTVRVEAEDAEGLAAEPLYVPAWLDDLSWDRGLMYFVFVDRYANGDGGNDAPYGANLETGDYLGGDWQGVMDHLDDLEALGVTVLWLTAPWDNPEGLYAGRCDAEITGYHGYWPVSTGDLEEHFGDEAALHALIDAAHDRNMRVLVDWVGNHVHDVHPLYAEHPDWFTPMALCEEANNWNDIPETCWFASYLPTIRYYDTAPLVHFVDEAVRFAQEYEIDGFRVDAVKHIPHAVHHNLDALIEARIEHTAAGGDEDFYTVGETFSGDMGLIASYIGENELDGQFDFNVYWSLLSTLARGSDSPVYALETTLEASAAVYGDATMSTFLGNHDVERFIAHAAGEVSSLYGDGFCPDGSWRGPDTPPEWDEPYQRLMLAWTWLLTHEGLPLIYYGDEIGLPGYHDPDNRQMMRFGSDLSAREAAVLDHVRALGQARRDFPQLLQGTRTTWWGEPDWNVLAWARHSEAGESLVAINRSSETRTLTNGLAWAGLTPGTTYTDVLTGNSYTASGDSLTITLPPWGSLALIAP